MPYSPHFITASPTYAAYDRPVPAPAFRRAFTLPAAPVTATLTVCGLGYYELFVNGARLTRGRLSSYTANADRILCYDHYDLAPHLTPGENAVGFLLGNGMQNCLGGGIWALDRLPGRSAPKLALWLAVMCADGSSLAFDASEGFLCADSPIRFDDLRAGEWYDARFDLGAWTAPGYRPDPATWRIPLPAATPKGVPHLTDTDPILPAGELAPVSVRPGRIGRLSEIDKSLPLYPLPAAEMTGVLYDFGVNTAGVCRLCLRNTVPGQTVTLLFGEKLLPSGGETDTPALDLYSMFYAPQAFSQRDVYICRGDAEETYTPTFTYHGFRYCLITGLREGQATPDALTAIPFHTALSRRATFSSSDETANRLWEITLASDLSNFHHFPTDCPQREKNGWTGDTSLSASHMLLALTPERNLREWLLHIRTAMRTDGSLPGIVPTGEWGYGHGPAWDNVIVNLPYYIWLYRGDTAVLRENAAAILAQLRYMQNRVDAHGLTDYGLGDWCPAGEHLPRTPTVVTSTLTCLDYARKAATVFDTLGMAAERQEAKTAAERLFTAARAHLIDPATATVCGSTVTAQALGLHMGLFSPAEIPAAVDRLLALLAEAGDTFRGCGILGLRVLFHVLAAHGHAALAYRLITQEAFPSYGYLLAHGATTLWETFHDPHDPSPSLNHHFFGDIVSWLLQSIAGIVPNPHRRDPNEVHLCPRFIPALTHARGTYIAPAGEIALAWERDGTAIRVTYRIHAGVRATFRPDDGWAITRPDEKTLENEIPLVGEGTLLLRPAR